MELKREIYLEQIRPFYDVDLIKVITGVRRCGKSIFLKQIMNELIESGIAGSHVIYISLEDLDYDFIKNAQDLNKEIKSRILDKDKYYIFLDEIQHIIEFEKALASFRATLNVSLFITGSNSQLLSGELATLLTGRIVEFEILPFSFYEMEQYYKLNQLDFNNEMIFDYLKWGGFPVRFDFKSEKSISKYIEELYNNILEKDIFKNKNKINKEIFKKISLYILANAGKQLSVDNLVNYFNSNNGGEQISRRTIYYYLDKMKNTYLIKPITEYTSSGKRTLASRNKYYAIDNAFRCINTNTIDYEDTFFLENIVFNELVATGYKVYYQKTYNSEIDFVAVMNGRKCYIQICYLIRNKEIGDREFGAFKSIKNNSPKYVLSLDKIDFSRDGITHINIIDFLLHKKRLNLS